MFSKTIVLILKRWYPRLLNRKTPSHIFFDIYIGSSNIDAGQMIEASSKDCTFKNSRRKDEKNVGKENTVTMLCIEGFI